MRSYELIQSKSCSMKGGSAPQVSFNFIKRAEPSFTAPLLFFSFAEMVCVNSCYQGGEEVRRGQFPDCDRGLANIVSKGGNNFASSIFSARSKWQLIELGIIVH